MMQTFGKVKNNAVRAVQSDLKFSKKVALNISDRIFKLWQKLHRNMLVKTWWLKNGGPWAGF